MREPITARYYDLVNTQTDDLDFYVRLAEEGGPICELGAGTGRIAVPIARAGMAVTGVDLSDAMLDRFHARLAGEPEDVRARVEVVRGDIRSWGPDGAFAQVFIPFRVLLALLTREDRTACLRNAWRLLRPGGRLALNVFHPSEAYMRQYSFDAEGSWRETVDRALPEGGHLRQLQSVVFDRLNQRIHVRWLWIERDADGATRVTEEPLELGWVWRDELLLHLELAGFRVETLHGGFDGRPLSEPGQEMVVTARRPGLPLP